SGAALDTDEAKVTIDDVPDRPGVAASIFKAIAAEAINVDMIVQNVSRDGTTDMSFTAPLADLPRLEGVLDALARDIGADGFSVDPGIAKLSLVGAGMKSHPGVAADMFDVLASEGINIEMISTSPIRISCGIRMEGDVPLVIPAVNPEALDGWPKPGIISVPNCTTITAMLAVAPLHRAAGCTSLVLSSYQAVSGAGHKAIAELLEQVEKLRGDEEALAHPDVPTLPSGPVMGRTIAYNVVPRIGAFQIDGFTGEEAKSMAEPRKILSAPDMPVVATAVRVPVLVGHAVSILAEFA